MARRFRPAQRAPWLAVLAILTSSQLAVGSNPYLVIPPPEEAMSSRAYHYANLSDEEALLELEERGIRYVHAKPPMPGVRLPIKLAGPLNGVTIRSTLPPERRKDTFFDIMDARLALALDDFTRILYQHDVVELVHFTIYRPAPERVEDPNAPQTRHPGGMAIDVGALRKRDGSWLSVGPHWPGAIGKKTCGRGGRRLEGDRGRELLSIVCEASDLRIFHYMLTPHFDEPHADHLHLEIKAGVKWFLVN